ncbi:DUF2934 domain-containing protein [Pseudomonas brassicacearum]|uniref:DUF2934 domain-containing protein n=1 Tax=Pseudomonas brassicacearum TaxID=930166 RepID=UPI000F473358
MDEQKIREAAYRLWENAGKPQGQDLEHWFTAEKSAGEEDFDSSNSGSTPGRKAAPSQAESSRGRRPK